MLCVSTDYYCLDFSSWFHGRDNDLSVTYRITAVEILLPDVFSVWLCSFVNDYRNFCGSVKDHDLVV